MSSHQNQCHQQLGRDTALIGGFREGDYRLHGYDMERNPLIKYDLDTGEDVEYELTKTINKWWKKGLRVRVLECQIANAGLLRVNYGHIQIQIYDAKPPYYQGKKLIRDKTEFIAPNNGRLFTYEKAKNIYPLKRV